MLVRAKHNIYDGKVMRSGGTVFEVESIDGLEKFVDVLDTPKAVKPKVEEPKADEPKDETPKPQKRKYTRKPKE